MQERLPFSKAELKKMFLRVLYETQYGKMKSYSHNIHGIIPHFMNEHYKIELKSEEEKLTYEAVQELKIKGLIVPDYTQRSEQFQLLTEMGKQIVENQQDPDIFGLRLEEIVKNQELLKQSLDSFNNGDYESAIFNAFKLVEETVRTKAGLDASDVGVNLMTKALKPTTGRLYIPSCQVVAEEDGIHSLFRGAIAFFKNPTSHRTVTYNDRLQAIQTIVFAEVLLNIVSTAIRR